MRRYLIVSIASGLLFGILDGALNANPLARRLYKVFEPIARKKVNAPAGLIIDLVYGFALAGIFLLVRGSLPFASHLLRGLAYGVLLWFLRVAMQVASQWMMFSVPGTTLLYTAAGGLVEMSALGVLYGLTL